jgi:hypothetical protein
MISGIVPFEEIVQSVKDETGLENLRPFYEKLRRLMFRGEREIGYGGSVELKKKTYIVVGSTGDCNFGKFFKFPEDFIELEGVGVNCCIVPEFKYTPTAEGIRFKEKQTKDIVVLYWGIRTDEQGYPMVTRNHEEAVVAFIVWKLYSSKIFLGIGNMNANKNYEQSFINALLEARGDDAFPTLEQWNALGQLSYTDRRLLIDQTVHSYDYCAEYEDVVCEGSAIVDASLAYWQLNSLTDDINDVIPLINNTYLDAKQNVPLRIFADGEDVVYTFIGRICFCIRNTEDINYILRDTFESNITNAFDVNYDAATRTKLYVSKNVYTYSTLNTKIETP